MKKVSLNLPLVSGLVVCGFMTGSLFALFFADVTARPPAVASSATALAGDVPPDVFAEAWHAREAWTVKPGTRALLVPHHMVAAAYIASLANAAPPASVIYLVSPDHYSRGRTAMTTTDAALARELPHMQVNQAAIQMDHGITTPLPFFTHAQPRARIVPILIRADANAEDRQTLAAALIRRLRQDRNALLVASVDFSHYLPPEVADFHDALSEDVIRSLDAGSADQTEINSPATLFVLLTVARELGLGDVTIHAHTNSLRILKALVTHESTSHFLASFAPGPIQLRHVTTVLRTSLLNLRSRENRLYRGQSSIEHVTSTQDMMEGLVVRDGAVTARFPFPLPVIRALNADSVY